MARGSSVIDVAIIGDAKKLIGATKDADKAVGGLLTSTAKLGIVGLGIGGVASEVSGFVDDALKKADTFNDSFDNLAGTIGKIDADKVKDVAFDMTNIGLSADEVGTLAEKLASFATSAGIAAPLIAAMTPDMIDLAVAISAKTGKPLNEVITDIGNAINGSSKPLRDYGITIDDNATASERLQGILDQGKAKYGQAADAIDDVSGAQDILTAKWDNFGIRVGENLEGPIHDLQLGLIYMADTVLPDLGSGFDTLGDRIGVWGKDALNPINLVLDALGGVGDLLHNLTTTGKTDLRTLSESEVIRNLARFNERNGQGAP